MSSIGVSGRNAEVQTCQIEEREKLQGERAICSRNHCFADFGLGETTITYRIPVKV